MSLFPLRKQPPALSIVVIVHCMQRHAIRTLYSLSLDYQREVASRDYEVLVVENRSDACLDPGAVAALKGRFRYFLRDEATASPVNAINFGVSRARSQRLCIMIDGARMVTPRLIATMLEAQQLSPDSIICVPGYHLGKELQQSAVNRGYSETDDDALLANINWPENGYRLFDIACFSGGSSRGFFQPYSESNCLGVSRQGYEAAGGFDPGFDIYGGGMANLDFYKRVCELPNARLLVLLGEGNFHQFHGGVTTGTKTSQRDPIMFAIKQHYVDLRGEEYCCPAIEPNYYGRLPAEVLRFLRSSLDRI